MNDLDGGYVPAESLLQSERIVVGSAIWGRGTFDDLAAVIRPEHFFRPAHGLIFGAASALAAAGAPVDPVSVADELTRAGDLAKAGGAPYLHDCMALAGPSAAWHARQVVADWRRRQLNVAGTRILQMTADPGYDAGKAFDEARRLVDDAAAADAAGPQDLGSLLADVMAGLESGPAASLATPWGDLNGVLSIVPGSSTVIAARPSVGKSVTGLMIAAHTALRAGLPAVVFSLEMSRDELALRLLAAEARVPLWCLVHHQVNDSDWNKLAAAHQRISDAPLLIDDDSVASVASVRSRIKAMTRAGQPPAVAVIDYLGLMASPGRAESRQQEVGALARGCKLVARETGIPVITLAQLNRSPEQRADRRPSLSDLRDSGQIEEHADNVLLLHREDVSNRETARPGEIDVIIAKNRQGPTTTLTLGFQGHYARIVELARLDQRPAA